MQQSEQADTAQKKDLIVAALQEKKGHEICVIDLREVEHAISDYFIVCHGESTTQVDALSDSTEKKLKEEAGIRPHHIEGRQNSQWILLDYFDILVHVFQEEYRSFYRLEDLWADGKVERIDPNKD